MTKSDDDIIVRVGTPEDMDQVVEVAFQSLEENAFVKPNRTKLIEDLWRGLIQDHGIIGIVGRPGNIIEGAVLLRLGTMWYSDDPVVEEKAIFIRPEYRSAKGGRARKLCEFSKQVADSLGIPLIIGVLSNQRTEAKIRLYRRQFGEPAGAFFLYGAKTGEAQ